MNSFADDLFWNSVSGEHEEQQRLAAITHAKVAIAPYWPFLSSARSERDFDNRLSLSLSRISVLVAPDTLDEVLSSLRDDYKAVTAGAKSSQDDKDLKKNSDDAKDQAKDETGTDSDEDKKNNQDSDDDDDDDDLGTTGPSADSTKKDNDKKNTKGAPKDLDKDQANDDSDTTSKGHWDKDNKTWTRETTGAFVPDPSDKNRYYAPYESLESLPLNNGDLQGPDGFPADLAEGEQRTPEAYARQITPGTWTLGPGMPERPMPQGVARGYQPVASFSAQGQIGRDVPGSGIVKGHYIYNPDRRSWSSISHILDETDGSTIVNGNHRIGPNETARVAHPNEVRWSKHDDVFPREGSLRFDKDGFLVESVVDPVPGAPLAGNPFYFDQGRSGITGDGFPQDPGPEPLADRANDYGTVGPVSTGSEEGQVDGNGYSRSQPGRQAARTGPAIDDPNGYEYTPAPENVARTMRRRFEGGGATAIHPTKPGHYLHGVGNWWDGPSEVKDNGDGSYSYTNPWTRESDRFDDRGYYSKDGTHKPWGHEASVEPRNFNLTAADHYNRGFYDRQNNRYYAGEEHQDTEEARTYRQGWDEAHEHYGGHAAADRATQNELFGHVGSIVEAGEHAPYRLKEDGGKWYVVNDDGVKKDEGYSSKEEAREHQKALYANVPGAAESAEEDEEKKGKTASTDGRIVDHCPGCDKPRRVHSTAHGDEIRHLHNDHVRCFGDKTAAQMGGEPTFKPGDHVISFRGEGATIHRVYPSGHPGKSNRVQVKWDDPERNLTWDGEEHPEGVGDQQAYYESVFKHHPDTMNHIQNMVDSAVPHSDQIIKAHSSVGWGHDLANHGSSWSFQDALAFNGENYTTHFDKEGFITEAGDYLGRPDANNPTGRGADEYKARTWDAFPKTRPLQSSDDRNVNTPVLPAEPIRTRNIGAENPQFDRDRTDRLEQPGEDEDED